MVKESHSGTMEWAAGILAALGLAALGAFGAFGAFFTGDFTAGAAAGAGASADDIFFSVFRNTGGK